MRENMFHHVNQSNSARYIPYYMWDRPVFPPYLYGAGYLMSRSAVRKLLVASITVPMLHIEDVYVTGLLQQKSAK